MSFPEISLAHDRKMEILKKWRSIPRGKLKFQKLLGQFFQYLPIRIHTPVGYHGGIVLKGVVKSIFSFLVKEYEK